MTLLPFPPLCYDVHGGLLLVSDYVDVPNLMYAYSRGIFPWPEQEGAVLWCSPRNRGVLFLDDVHVSRSLRKTLKQKNFTFTVNTAFDRVIEACSSMENRGDQTGTWIIPGMKKAYRELHRLGYAVSVETWNAEGELVGGLYGVTMNGFFGGESMFYRESGASKGAILHLIEKLRQQHVTFIDCQMVTSGLEQLGAVSIQRADFLRLLQTALSRAPLKL